MPCAWVTSPLPGGGEAGDERGYTPKTSTTRRNYPVIRIPPSATSRNGRSEGFLALLSFCQIYPGHRDPKLHKEQKSQEICFFNIYQLMVTTPDVKRISPRKVTNNYNGPQKGNGMVFQGYHSSEAFAVKVNFRGGVVD